MLLLTGCVQQFVVCMCACVVCCVYTLKGSTFVTTLGVRRCSYYSVRCSSRVSEMPSSRGCLTSMLPRALAFLLPFSCCLWPGTVWILWPRSGWPVEQEFVLPRPSRGVWNRVQSPSSRTLSLRRADSSEFPPLPRSCVLDPLFPAANARPKTALLPSVFFLLVLRVQASSPR